jgi:hypothetical protein
MAIEKTCGYCDKRGLLILPVRYAVAPIDMGLPAVTAPLKVEDTARGVGKGQKQDLTLHGSARYTTRLLRCGYLYVYGRKARLDDGVLDHGGGLLHELSCGGRHNGKLEVAQALQ